MRHELQATFEKTTSKNFLELNKKILIFVIHQVQRGQVELNWIFKKEKYMFRYIIVQRIKSK